jgi:alkaline phosphatase D
MNNTEESFLELGSVSVDQRKMNAVRAYFEYQPIRQVAMDDNLRIWRNFKLGKLVDLIMLDTRNYDRSITTLGGWNDPYIYEISNDAGRSLMGGRQENWFYQSLIDSKNRGATWRIIGSQIVFSRINITSSYGSIDIPFNGDQWDGYLANRNRTYQTLLDNDIGNNIMLAGDSHASWVSDLVWFDHSDYDPDTGAGAVGVEFGGTAVSSSGYGSNITQGSETAEQLLADNPELQYTEGYYRGYFELHISAAQVDAKYFGVPTVAERTPYELSMANFTVVNGQNRLQRPLSGGVAESGALRGGEIQSTNVTWDTEAGGWSVQAFEQMFIQYPEDDE